MSTRLIRRFLPNWSHRSANPFIYLACPYTSPDPEVRQTRVEVASVVAAELAMAGKAVYSPITHGHPMSQHLPTRLLKDHDFWMGQCLPILAAADELWLLPLEGWAASRGVCEELAFAEQHGIPIKFIDRLWQPWDRYLAKASFVHDRMEAVNLCGLRGRSMTTAPAMPELPEPELGHIKTDKSHQPAFSARQMRAAMQAQPAEVSDEEIYALWVRHCETPGTTTRQLVCGFARAILTQQATPEPVGEPWGWAIEDKHGVAQAIRPARKEFFGCVQSSEPFTAEDVSKMDCEWAGLAPHRIVTLFTHPAPGVPDGFALAQAEFNRAIDFAIKEGIGAAIFLDAWRHGDTSEWPEFEADEPAEKATPEPVGRGRHELA